MLAKTKYNAFKIIIVNAIVVTPGLGLVLDRGSTHYEILQRNRRQNNTLPSIFHKDLFHPPLG
jgi:hypothetical protein